MAEVFGLDTLLRELARREMPRRREKGLTPGNHAHEAGERRRLPIIALAANAYAEDRDRCLAAVQAAMP